jgi:hypothetical protein
MREPIEVGKEPPSREAVERTVRDLLPPEEDVDYAYLFGAVAKERTRAASDVDAAVHLRAGSTQSERFERGLELESRLERALDRPTQVVVLNDAPLELRFNVLAHGILLTARDDAARREFYVDTGRRYYDMAPARALFRRRQQERIREGTFGG